MATAKRGELLRRASSTKQDPVVESVARVIALDHVTPSGSSNVTARRYQRIGHWLALTDALCFVVSLFISYLVRFGLRPLPLDWAITALISPVIWLITFRGFRLHAPQYLSNWEEFTRTISASSIGIIVVALLSYWSKTSFSRAWIGLTWLFALTFELMSRRIWRWHVARERMAGRLSYRTLVIGTNDESRSLLEALNEPHSGFDVVGFVSVNGSRDHTDGRVVARIDELKQAVSDFDVECLFVAATSVTNEHMSEIVQTARRLGVEIRISANLPEMAAPRLTVQQVGLVMTLALKPVRLSGLQAFAKRLFDVVVAALGLTLLSPVIGAVMIAIRWESTGPLIFRQQRVTKNGRIFTMFKFRTMLHDADRFVDLDAVDVTAPFFKLEDDPRLTRVGRFIRRWSLDELPQLWNVLRGDMSIVGPRPLPVDQVLANDGLLTARHEVASGITGWWQINGRSNVAADQALKMDLFYIENWSLALDVYIVLKTIGALLARRGAY